MVATELVPVGAVIASVGDLDGDVLIRIVPRAHTVVAAARKGEVHAEVRLEGAVVAHSLQEDQHRTAVHDYREDVRQQALEVRGSPHGLESPRRHVYTCTGVLVTRELEWGYLDIFLVEGE